MRFSLHTKLLLIYLLIVMVVAVVLDFYLIRSLRDDVSMQIRQELIQEARLIQTYLEAAPPDLFSQATIDPIVDRLGEQCDARITVISMDGTVLGDSSIPLPDLPGLENYATRPEVMDALREMVGQSVRYSTTLDTDMAYVAVSFQHKGFLAGVVRLALPLTAFEWIEGHRRRIVLFALIIGVCLAVILSYATSGLMSGAIEKMTAEVEKISPRGYAPDAMPTLSHEFRDLSGALKNLMVQSKNRIDLVAEENTQLEAVLAGMTEGVMVTDTSGHIVLTNPAFTGIAGTDRSCLGKRPIEIIRSNELQDVVDNAFKRDHPDIPVETLEIVVPNTRQTLQVHLAMIRTERQIRGLVAVFHDITELRRLERIRRDFVANVSHELRTPLTSIKGFTETLMDGALDDPETAVRFVGSIQKQTNRLQAIVEDLLQLSRMESGRAELAFRPCNMRDIAQRVIESMHHRFAHKRQVVRVDIAPVEQVTANEALMEQVLVNLLDNAIKYTPEEGVISVRVYQEAKEVRLYVADTGPGIPSDALPRIFERFYRVDRARSRELGGTGLGLSIVKHVVELHKGRVWVESELGRGSTFHVALKAMEDRMDQEA